MIMSKFKNMYKEFFGLKESTAEQQAALNVELEKTKELTQDVQDLLNANNDPLLDEAQLVNNLSDYNGHVMYQLRDPQEANPVAKEIQRWTTKKGFTIISHEKSKSGHTGYFYFRLGEDPGTESQKIQGYFAQLPELLKFVFKAPKSKESKKMKQQKF
jgi:predicted O-linked N-acetylglucosamine transferase (SPINDLY family)